MAGLDGHEVANGHPAGVQRNGIEPAHPWVGLVMDSVEISIAEPLSVFPAGNGMGSDQQTHRPDIDSAARTAGTIICEVIESARP